MVAPMGIGHEAFGTIRRPAHRAAELAGGPGDDGFFRIMVDLAAKAAAHIRRNHAQLRFRQMEHMGTHQQANDMRVLAGGGECVIARGAIKLAHRRTGFHGIRDQAVIHQIEFHHMRGTGKGGIHHGLVADMPIIT